MAVMVTKGCKAYGKEITLDIDVHTYNTGFYITVREQMEFGTLVGTTTRNTPAKVIKYIGSLLTKYKIPDKKVSWKPNVKVIKDKETGLNKTNI